VKIQLNTDKNIAGTEALGREVEARVAATLHRYEDQLTRVEVHLTDESGPRTGGDDKRCLIEARPAGLNPIAVTHHAPSVDLAIDGALEKLMHALSTHFGKLDR